MTFLDDAGKVLKRSMGEVKPGDQIELEMKGVEVNEGGTKRVRVRPVVKIKGDPHLCESVGARLEVTAEGGAVVVYGVTPE